MSDAPRTPQAGETRFIDHPRMLLVVGAIILVSGLIFVNGIRRQILDADEITREWGWRTNSTLRIMAPRGSVLDVSGRPLAWSDYAPHIGIDPQVFFDRDAHLHDAIRDVLSRNRHVDLAAFDRAVDPASPTAARRYVRIGQHVPLAEETMRELRALNVQSIYPTIAYQRRYPFGAMAGNVLGTYFSSEAEAYGESGIERSYEAWLRSSEIEVQALVDASANAYFLRDMPELDDARGNDIHMTFDARLQRWVEDVLQQTLEQFGATQAMAVVSRPQTGDVVAMAQLPGFDPASRGARAGDVWLNYNTGAVFEPGSTMKILTFAAALDAGVIGESGTIDCQHGRIHVGSKVVRDTTGVGVVPLERAFQISSNVASVRLGRILGQARMMEYLERFGLGQVVGLGLGSEQPGEYKRARWADSELATISYGYGINLNTLQLNMLTATIANDGMRMKPRMVTHVTRPDGTVVAEFPPVEATRAVSERSARAVQRFMNATTQNVQGATGRRAAIPGIPVAAKTGTAQLVREGGGYHENLYVSSITGFVPADRPRFVITIMVVGTTRERGYYGGEVAGPAFARIGAQALLLDGVHVDEAEAYLRRFREANEDDDDDALEDDAPTPSRRDARSVDAGGVPDVVGLWAGDAVRTLLVRGYQPRVYGAGRVVLQNPPPGPLRAGDDTTIHLHLEHFDRIAGLDEGGR